MTQQHVGQCHLCSQAAPLRKSHIVPNWAWRQLRGADGKIVDLNKSTMHSYALIERLLCERCEQLFSKWENLAKGFGDKSDINSEYGPWLLKFATSISWRVLKYQLMRDRSELNPGMLAILQHPSVPKALDCWAQFLLHDRFTPDSKNHRQHLFLVSPDYVLRSAIGLTLGAVDGHVFTYTRFSFYCLIGVIESKNPKQLDRNHINVRRGKLPDASYLTKSMAKYLIGLEEESLALLILFAKKNDPDFFAELERRVSAHQ